MALRAGLLKMPITGIAGCCARATSGHVAVAPPSTVMNSRRRIALPKAGTTPNRTRLQQGFMTGGMGSDRHFARILRTECPLWVKSGHCSASIDVRYSPESAGGLTLLAPSSDTAPDSRFQTVTEGSYGYAICRRAGFQRLPS